MAERYLILGAGASGLAAAKAIREKAPESEIYVAFSDAHPYSRMLTPYYLNSEINENALYEHNELFLKSCNAKLLAGRRAARLFAEERYVEFADGEAVGYDKLLIATGSTPINRWALFERIVSLWDFDDVRRFKEQLAKIDELIIIGSGFIGMIFANALHKIGKKITIIEKFDTILPRMLPPEAALIFEKALEDEGVNLLTGDAIKEIEEAADKITVVTSQGRRITTDMAIAAVGVKPNIDFLNGSGIKTDRGVVVDKNMRASDKSVFASGDIAQVISLNQDVSKVYPTWPEAVEQGRAAGFNMAGCDIEYPGGLLYNTVTFGSMSAASFGKIDKDTEIIKWKDASKGRFVQFWIEDGKPVGACLVGDNSRIGMLKGLIMQSKTVGNRIADNPTKFAEAFLLSNHFAGHEYKG